MRPTIHFRFAHAGVEQEKIDWIRANCRNYKFTWKRLMYGVKYETGVFLSEEEATLFKLKFEL